MSSISEVLKYRGLRTGPCSAQNGLPLVNPNLPPELNGKTDWFRLNLRPYGHSASQLPPSGTLIYDVSGPEIQTEGQRSRALLRAFRGDFDFDHDGKVSEVEKLRGRLLLAQARQLDKDHDGVFSVEELCGKPAQNWWNPSQERHGVPDLSQL